MKYRTIISIGIPVSWKQKLSEIAQERTILSQRQYTISELIRDAINEVYDLDYTPPRREGRE